VAVLALELVSQQVSAPPMHLRTPSWDAAAHSPNCPPLQVAPTPGSPAARPPVLVPGSLTSALSILPSQSLSIPSHTSGPRVAAPHWYAHPLSGDLSTSYQPGSHWSTLHAVLVASQAAPPVAVVSHLAVPLAITHFLPQT